MTLRLYYTDAYLTTFAATVTGRTDGGTRVYLDRTAFYPTSGGQPHDTGRLGGATVLEVVDEGDRIAHLLDAPPAGDRVEGEVDWPRRFDHMQQHTGQHLLSAVFADLAGHATTGVHFGREGSTLDLDVASLAPETVAEAELRANRIVTQNRPVEVTFEEAGSADGLRKPSTREGALRIVTIRDLDRSACGGTHVRATGEIGPVVIRGVERVRRAVRVEFLCGERAIRRTRADQELLAGLAAALSAAPAELPALVEAQRRALAAAEAGRRELEGELAGYRARELYRSAAPTGAGRRVVRLREEGGPLERLRPLAQAVAALPAGVFVGAVGQPPGLILAVAEDAGLDAGRVLKEVLAGVGGRGGGTARLAQGGVPGPEALDVALAALEAAIERAGRY
jgi:alanyl-tRNA synthetase